MSVIQEPIWRSFLFVALGGGLGSMGRFAVSLALGKWVPGFPLGTLLVNVLGSFGIAFFSYKTGSDGKEWALNPQLRHLLFVGFFGGFTTFSSFSLQTIELIQKDRIHSALANVGLSIICCLFAAWAGISAAR